MRRLAVGVALLLLVAGCTGDQPEPSVPSTAGRFPTTTMTTTLVDPPLPVPQTTS